MDGDARRLWAPQGSTGYTVHLDYNPTAPARVDAPPAPRRARDTDRDDRKRPDGETHDDADHDDNAADAGDDKDGADKKDQKRPMPRWKKILYWAIGIALLLVLIVAGLWYWQYSRQFESTDDAFIDGHISQISAQIGGRVTRLAIADYDQVKAGQLLVELDPRDLQVKLDQARAQRTQAAAQLDQARAGLVMQQANVDQAQAQVRVAEADLGQAQTDLARYRGIDPKAITRQQLDTASAGAKSAQAKVDANRQAVAAARANIAAQQAQIEAAQANLAQADVAIANATLQLSYTSIVAPSDGKVAKRTVEVGNYVNPGQALLAVVGTERWVTANFKETQLAAMRRGQHVRVRVDACPDHSFDGSIDSFQPGSGSIFSSLPAENATGNYVKVVQRVPVKIVFQDTGAPDCQLSPGMSVTPRVTVR